MEYTAKNKNKSSKPLVKKIPAVVISLVMLGGVAAVYKLTQTNTTESEAPVPTMPEITTVTALSRLEPSGEIIRLSVSSGVEGKSENFRHGIIRSHF